MRQKLLFIMLSMLLQTLAVAQPSIAPADIDLRFFGLTGRVKSFTEGGVIYTFNKEGNLVMASTPDGDKPMALIHRDSQGQIIYSSSGVVCDMDGEIYGSDYTWDMRLGVMRVKTIEAENPEGVIKTTINYNGNTLRELSHTIKATGMNYSGRVTFSDYKTDSHGNWTSRKANYALRCVEDGNSPLNYSEIHTRNIEYWPTTLLDQAREYMVEGNGKGRDYEKAGELLEQAVEQGDTDAMWELGLMWMKGLGGREPSWTMAFDLFKRSANADNPIGKYWLAEWYSHPVVPEDNKPELAMNLYKLAQEQLSKQSWEQDCDRYTWLYLGRMAYLGGPGDIDLEHCKQYMQTAANMGSDEAQFLMGEMYADGVVISKDLKVAEKWYKVSANQGNNLAQERMGDINAGMQLYNWALQWYKKSAAQGNENAQRKLQELKQKMHIAD